MFSDADSAQISDTYTAVRLIGGQDLDDEGRAFMKRYGVGGYPTLLAMTADGALLTREFDRTLDGIMQTMESAATANEGFLVREAELKDRTDTESVRVLAGLYKGRAQLEEARTRFEKLVGSPDPLVEDQLALLEVYESLGDQAARKAMLGTLIATRQDDERHIEWRMELAMADLPTSVTSREEWEDVMGKRAAALEGLVGQVEKPADQAVVHNVVAQTLNRLGQREKAMVHWEWILENARDSKVAASALMMKAQGLFRTGQAEEDIERLRECKALLQEILDKHAEHPAANGARQGIPMIEGAIEKIEKAAAEADAPEDEGDAPEDEGDAPEEGDDPGGEDDEE